MEKFTNLAEDPAAATEPAVRSIAIVTPDLRGPVRNGGVGTACAALAELLASQGHKVTVVFADLGARVGLSFRRHQKLYLDKGIELVLLPAPKASPYDRGPLAFSQAACEYLRKRRFDIVHFPDIQGLGYASQVAKKKGLAFAKTLFCVTLHGPTRWHKDGNRELLSSLWELQCFELERRSVEMADVLVAPSQHAMGWAVESRWTLPKRAFVEQCPFPEAARPQYQGSYRDLDEVVFFGRLETRKGLENLCDAIAGMPRAALRGKKVTFLGTYGKVKGKGAKEYLDEITADWPVELRVINDFGQEEALNYLRSRSVLVVIPSHSETFGYTTVECIGAGIPYIASDIPAYRELITPADQKAVLFRNTPDGLRRKLAAVLRAGTRKTALAIEPSKTNGRWADWHARVRLPTARAPRVEVLPLPAEVFARKRLTGYKGTYGSSSRQPARRKRAQG